MEAWATMGPGMHVSKTPLPTFFSTFPFVYLIAWSSMEPGLQHQWSKSRSNIFLNFHLSMLSLAYNHQWSQVCMWANHLCWLFLHSHLLIPFLEWSAMESLADKQECNKHFWQFFPLHFQDFSSLRLRMCKREALVGSAATAVAHFVVIKRVEKERATSTLAPWSKYQQDCMIGRRVKSKFMFASIGGWWS